jgi:hypothetical protein
MILPRGAALEVVMFRVIAIAGAMLITGGASGQEVAGQFYIGSTAIGGYVLQPIEGGYGVDAGFGSGGIDLFAGYNLIGGNTLFGFEGSIGHGLTSGVLADNEFEYRAPADEFRRLFDQGDRPPPAGIPDTVGTYDRQVDFDEPLAYDYRRVDQLRVSGSGTISARVGMALPDTLLYLRIGGGLAQVHRTIDETYSARSQCVSLNQEVSVFDDGYEIIGIDCAASEARADTTDNVYTNSTIAPVVLAAIGAERSFGQMFVRGEVAAAHIFYHESRSNFGIDNGLTSFNARVGAGVRF